MEPIGRDWRNRLVLPTFRTAGPGSAIHRVCMNDLFEKGRRAGPRIASAKDAMDRRVIAIRGAREHNLKNVDVEIPARPARGVHRPVRLRQILARLRHHLCRGPAPLRRVAVGLRAAVPGDDAEAGRRPDRRPVARHLHRAEDHLEATRARRSAPSPRSTTTCGCCGRASACPIRRPPACRSRARPCRRWSTACWRCPRARGSIVLAPVVRGRKGEYRKELAEFLKKGYQRVKIDGAFYEIGEVAAARQEIHPRHRRGGRPPRGARRHLARGSRIRSSRRSSSPRAWRWSSSPTPRVGGAKANKQRNENAERLIFSEKFACPVSGFTIPEIEPRLFSFNNPFGACPECGGLGVEQHIDADLVIPDKDAHLAQGRDRAVGEIVVALLHADARRARQALQVHARHQVEGPAEEDPGRHPLRLRRRRDPLHLRRRHARLRDQEAVRGRHHQSRAPLQGDRERLGARGDLQKYFTDMPCDACKGYRLKPEALCVKIAGKHIGEVSELSVKARRRMVHRAAASSSTPSRTRSPSACSRKSASG